MYPVEDCTCNKDCDKCKTVIGQSDAILESKWRTGGIVQVQSTFSSSQASNNGYIAVYVTFKVCGMKINAMFGFTGIPLYHQFDFEHKKQKFRGYRVMIQSNVFYPNHKDYLFGFSYSQLSKDFDPMKNIIYQVIYTDQFPEKTHDESILKCGNGTCDAGETIKNCPIDCDNDICPKNTTQKYCGLGFYKQNSICLKCASGCQMCSFRVNCTQCFKGYFLQFSKCVQKCSKGQYGDKQLKICKKCDKACKTCFGNGQYNCIKCSPGYSINKINQLELCKRSCQNNCKTCKPKDKQQCLSCFKGDFLHQFKCQKKCPFYFYKNSKEKLCSKCLENCMECKDNKICQQCAKGFFLDQNQQCVIKCQQFYYEDRVLNICSKCLKNCKKCQNKFKCDACMTGFEIVKDVCVHDCKYGQYRAKQGSCKPCDVKCKSCLNEFNKECSKCQDGFYLNPIKYDCQECFGSCQKECIIGSYFNKVKKVCSKCHKTCLSCDGHYETDCLSCQTKVYVYLENKQCKKECKKLKYFSNKELKLCQPCKIKECLECLKQQDLCSKCDEDFYLMEDEKSCEKSCPIAYQLLQNTCKKCKPEHCIYCSLDLQTCLQCIQDKVLYEHKCYTPCQTSQYRDNNTKTCRPCMLECKTCVSYTNKDCLSCNNKLVFNSLKKLQDELIGNCISECPKVQYYYDTLLEMCQKCHESCQTCKGPGRYNCNTCIQDYYKAKDDRCFKYCPTNLFYQNKQKSTCEQCKVYGCMNCQEGADMCQLCKANYYTQIENNRKVCKQQCSESYFKQQNQCLRCDKSCKSCTGQRNTECINCHHKLYLHIKQGSSGACLQKCPQQFYFAQNETGTCEKCHSACEQCKSPSEDCILCKVDYYKQDNRCQLEKCNRGFYKHLTKRQCIKCHITCLSCKGDKENQCLNCQRDYYLTSKNKCNQTCPDQYYQNKDTNNCDKCDQKCSLCVDQTDKNCQKCNIGFYLHNNSCFDKCPEYHYAGKKGNCLNCYQNCKSCIGEKSNQCTSCRINYFLQENICLKQCQEMFYGENNKCYRCPKECLTCLASSYCTSCKNGFAKLNNKCVFKCMQQQYVDNRICKQCDQRCSKCFGPKINQCISCSNGQYLINQKCQEKCPFSYYEDQSLLICQKCHVSCKTCKKEGQYSCISCYNDQVLDTSNSCKNQCNQYEYLQKGICHKCAEQCQSCFGPKQDQCIECSKGFCESQPHSCVKKCPGTYVCEKRKCVQFCQQGFKYLSENKCVEQCPSFLLQDKINKQCAKQCPTGTFQISKELNQCDNCSNYNKVILDNYCQDKCSKGYYIDKINTLNQYICNDCNENCKKDYCMGPDVEDCLDCSQSQELDQSLNCIQNCNHSEGALMKLQCYSKQYNGYLLYLLENQKKYSLYKLTLNTNLYPKVFIKQNQKNQLKQYRKDEDLINWEQYSCGTSQIIQTKTIQMNILLTNQPQCEIFIELINNVKIQVQFKGAKQSIYGRIVNDLQQKLTDKLNIEEKQLFISEISTLYKSNAINKRILQQQEITQVEYILMGSQIQNNDEDLSSVKQSEDLQHKIYKFKDFIQNYDELNPIYIDYTIYIGKRPNSLQSEQIQGNFTQEMLNNEIQIQKQENKLNFKYVIIFGAIIVLIISLLLVIIYILNKIVQKQRQQEYEIKKVQNEINDKTYDMSPQFQNEELEEDENIQENDNENEVNDTQNGLKIQNNKQKFKNKSQFKEDST